MKAIQKIGKFYLFLSCISLISPFYMCPVISLEKKGKGIWQNQRSSHARPWEMGIHAWQLQVLIFFTYIFIILERLYSWFESLLAIINFMLCPVMIPQARGSICTVIIELLSIKFTNCFNIFYLISINNKCGLIFMELFYKMETSFLFPFF
jgi:hypothetical protein